jgi:Variant SH3 domain
MRVESSGWPSPPYLLDLCMPTFTANADYEEKDRRPMKLESGDEVNVGPADQAWPGWVWATDHDGRDGYIPEAILEPVSGGRYAVMEDYDPRVLTLKRGDRIESIRQIHGWHWCRNERDEEGWVGGYLLKPV